MERCLLGMSLAQAFADPFADEPAAEKDDWRVKRYAKLVMGPLLLGYLSWLTVKLGDGWADGVLFAARDGYLPCEFYQAIQKKFPEWNLPPGMYFYTNRRTAFLPNAAESGSDQAVIGLVEHLKLSLSPEKLLLEFFDLPAQAVWPPASENVDLREYIAMHAVAIAEQARKARMAYYRYMDNLGLRMGGRYVFMDFVATGTCQMYLEQFAPFELKGLYFGRTMYDRGYDIAVETYLRGEFPELLENYMELESYMTSLEPSLQRFDEDGRPQLAEELRTKRMMDDIQTMHQAVREYVYTFLRLFWWERGEIDPALPEQMYAINKGGDIYRENYDDWAQCSL